MNKSIYVLFMALSLIATSLSACSSKQSAVEPSSSNVSEETSGYGSSMPESEPQINISETESSEEAAPAEESVSVPPAASEPAVSSQTAESRIAPAGSAAAGQTASESTPSSAISGNTPENGAGTSEPVAISPAQSADAGSERDMSKINITVGDQVFAATFYDNASAKAIAEQMPFTLNMSDYASQEKVTALAFDLPQASTQTPSTIRTGELSLWSGNSLVLFYTSFSNSYSYIPIGAIDDIAGLTAALGSGDVLVAFSIQK